MLVCKTALTMTCSIYVGRLLLEKYVCVHIYFFESELPRFSEMESITNSVSQPLSVYCSPTMCVTTFQFIDIGI